MLGVEFSSSESMTGAVNSLAVQKHEELYVLEEPDRKNGPNSCSE
ncbi:hypothetical protein SAMN04488065_2659 [Haloplanus vescus]|uniref:Uncharacterized protein n=1 Tax=Haloplanus vescus TaxID=555874 RepID=A0A1H4A8R7_9EURY|nr:hypothetical protein SAMN04488065_2659 [Haloplanus vescus]